jgi:hypothetical protein
MFWLTGKVAVANSAFVGNTALGGLGEGDPGVTGIGGDGLGGAVCNDSASILVVNSTLAQNLAQGGSAVGFSRVGGSGYGGGLAATGPGSTALVNATISDNTASKQGASFSIAAGLVQITNVIVVCATDQTNFVGSVMDGGHNICSDGSANFTSLTSRNNTNPLLGALGYYGGLTPNLPLLPNSPAIDAGDNAACPATDQRGVTRPQGLACDIGAFELYPTLTLSPAAQGKVSVLYHFKAFETNDVSNSITLTNWVGIGTRVSNAQGTAELEQVDSAQVTTRFYRLVPK